jgi:hypothetical protein
MFEGLLTLGLAVMGVIVWSVRQEGRINGHDVLFAAQTQLDEVRLKLADERHSDVKERLTRIELMLSQLKMRAL